jgi:hypothetical protein
MELVTLILPNMMEFILRISQTLVQHPDFILSALKQILTMDNPKFQSLMEVIKELNVVGA